MTSLPHCGVTLSPFAIRLPPSAFRLLPWLKAPAGVCCEKLPDALLRRFQRRSHLPLRYEFRVGQQFRGLLGNWVRMHFVVARQHQALGYRSPVQFEQQKRVA